MNGSQAIAEILTREGVECVFCFPFTPILDALSDAGIRPIVARQERVAENMADGFSRVHSGDQFGVITVQQAAGVENAFAGIAHAKTDSSPVLFLPGHPGRDYVGVSPTFDAVENYRATTKWADRIPSAGQISQRMRRAYTKLRSGRPGPVMLEIPVDVANEPVDSLEYRPPTGLKSSGDPTAVVDACKLIRSSERPMIWAGQGVLYAQASGQLTQLAEAIDSPVMTTLLGKSAFNEQHRLSLGAASLSSTQMVKDYIKRCDTIIAIGASVTKTIFAAPIPEGKRIIHITNDVTDINKDCHPDVSILGDAGLVLDQMLSELADEVANPLIRESERKFVDEVRQAWIQRWSAKLKSDESPINPYRVIHDLMTVTNPDNCIVTHDSGNPRDQLVPIYEATVPRSYLGWGHSTQLGFSLGASMGAKLAAPEKDVIHFLGDAAFGMVGMDVETAVREEIPILTMLLNNSAMGNYEKNIPISSEKFGTKFLSGNYSDVARGLGAWSKRVESAAEVVPAIKEGLEQTRNGKAALLEFITCEEPDMAMGY